jgi:hypothetical protein
MPVMEMGRKEGGRSGGKTTLTPQDFGRVGTIEAAIRDPRFIIRVTVEGSRLNGSSRWTNERESLETVDVKLSCVLAELRARLLQHSLCILVLDVCYPSGL